MNQEDLFLALTWVIYRKSQVRKKTPQDIIDKFALRKLQQFTTEATVSAHIKQEANDLYAKARNSTPSEADRYCCTFCRMIIQQCDREIFDQLLALNPSMIPAWTKIWNTERKRKNS